MDGWMAQLATMFFLATLFLSEAGRWVRGSAVPALHYIIRHAPRPHRRFKGAHSPKLRPGRPSKVPWGAPQ